MWVMHVLGGGKKWYSGPDRDSSMLGTERVKPE